MPKLSTARSFSEDAPDERAEDAEYASPRWAARSGPARPTAPRLSSEWESAGR